MSGPNEVVIPAFYDLPAAAGDGAEASPATGTVAPWFLLAQVKENMTLTKPTLIVTDRRGVDFAVMFDGAIDLGPFRRGRTTLVVPGARRTDRGAGKKPVVVVPAAAVPAVRAVPAPLDRVLALGARLSRGDGRACAACGRAPRGGDDDDDGENDGAAADLMRCTGCACVRYCSKECQIKGWNELGHKADCKALKAMKEIQGIGSA